LVDRRKCNKAESRRRRYKCQILRFININPNICREEIKTSCEAAFYWLYQHEKEWLESMLPIAQRTKHVDRIDWVKRDIDVSIIVDEILKSTDERLTRAGLDRMIGGHGWLTSKISKLPNTKCLLIQHRLISDS